MKYRSLLMLVIGLCAFYNQGMAQRLSAIGKNSPIIIEIEFSESFKKDKIYLDYVPSEYAVRPARKTGKPEFIGNMVKWTLPDEYSLVGDLSSVFGGGHIFHLYEPGDSIHIDIRGKNAIYSGKGSEKLRLMKELKEKWKSNASAYISDFDPLKAHPDYYEANTLRDYQEWNISLNKQEEAIDSIFESYRNKISPYAFNYLKAHQMADMEHHRLMKFNRLLGKVAELGISGEALGKIFDETAQNKYARWLHACTSKVGMPYYLYDFVRKSVQRRYNFNYDHDSLKNAGRKIRYANLAKKIYKGEPLQECLVFLLTESGLKEHTFKDGVTPEIEQILDDFYAMPGYPEYKAYVKGYEQMIREWVIHTGGNAPDFNLKDANGKEYSKRGFKDKILLLGFFDDSKESAEMIAAIKKVQTVFGNHRDVAFLNVFCGMDKAAGQNVLSVGKEDPILKYYNVKAYPEFNVKVYPRLFLLDNRGQFVYNGEFGKDNGGPLKRNAKQLFPDPTKDKGQALINDIYEQLARINDGPYVFHGKDAVTAYSIHSLNISEQKFPVKSVNISVQTDDLRKTFQVQLKNKLSLEPPVTVERPAKLFVLSDIEGNFEAFRKLLQANKIIDNQFNWIFGNGHLVFAGDMFDRGIQVTECLWLVYILEEKARVAGGYVHFVLGNHEIMNLQGNHRYVHQKYKDNAVLMGKTLVQLYNEDSELGRWLRTKNIVEKIGDLLFMHGGVSAELNAQPVSIEQINALARPFYADGKAAENPDTKIRLLYNDMTSPFWYRLYYKESQKRGIYKAKESQIDSTLQKFKVKHIITGHTIVADTISTHYNNKVINTDTRHRDGKSEALLIEGKSFYRVNQEGKKVLLFRDEEK